DSLKQLNCPEDVRARIAADLAAGYAVVAPSATVALGGTQRLGWWQVDVASGRTIGVMDTGFYEDTAEYNETTQISTPMQRAKRLLETVRNLSSMQLHREMVNMPPGAYDVEILRTIETLQAQMGRMLDVANYLGD